MFFIAAHFMITIHISISPIRDGREQAGEKVFTVLPKTLLIDLTQYYQ